MSVAVTLCLSHHRVLGVLVADTLTLILEADRLRNDTQKASLISEPDLNIKVLESGEMI